MKHKVMDIQLRKDNYMYRIIEGRGTGKTSRLMLLAKENNAIFVCENPRAMEYKAQKYGIEGIRFISYAHFFNHYQECAYRNQKYVIDEIEVFIQQALFYHSELAGYTLTLE